MADSVIVSTTNLGELRETLNRSYKELVGNAVKTMCFIGERCVKIAREDHAGNWNDITGNLRSSIGYVVMVNGEVASEGGFNAVNAAPGERKVGRTRKLKDGTTKEYFATIKVGGDGEAGSSAGKALLEKLKPKFPKGIALIVCAGMNYASYVEEIGHRVVLSGAKLLAEQLAKQLLKSILQN